MMRALAAGTVLALLTAGCATQQTWVPTVDTFNNSRNQYIGRDMEECRALALRVSGSAPEEAVRGAVTGGLVGAAAGAAIGAAFGNAGRGAAVGAATGGIGAGASRASQSEQAFQQAYANCMRQRGHNVLN
jgi:outer membrane lipoprotein SlyB